MTGQCCGEERITDKQVEEAQETEGRDSMLHGALGWCGCHWEHI